MKKLLSFVFCSLVLSACTPTPTVEGEVISTRELGKGYIEHLIQTDSPHIPYFILRTSKKELQKGAKVVLELQSNSLSQIVN